MTDLAAALRAEDPNRYSALKVTDIQTHPNYVACEVSFT